MNSDEFVLSCAVILGNDNNLVNNNKDNLYNLGGIFIYPICIGSTYLFQNLRRMFFYLILLSSIYI